MLCRLCFQQCLDFEDLYDQNEQTNHIYKICQKFFQKEMEKFDSASMRCSKIICDTCWKTIKDFNDFHEKVIAAQENYYALNVSKKLKRSEVQANTSTFTEANETETIDLVEEPPYLEEATTSSSVLNDNEIRVENELSFDEAQYKFLYNSLDDGSVEPADDDDCEIVSDDSSGDEIGEDYEENNEDGADNFDEDNIQGSDDSNNGDFKTTIQKGIENDKLISRWMKVLPCDLCSMTFENFGRLTYHFREAHPYSKPYVRCCNKRIMERSNLVDHVKWHFNPESFKCDKCGECCKNRRILACHMKSAHGAAGSERPSEDFVCPHCNKGFIMETRLKAHIKFVHSEADCICEECGRAFKNIYVLRDHYNYEHLGVEKPKWACDECDAELATKQSLARHKRRVHHDGTTTYICSDCGKDFLNVEALKCHKKNVHEKTRKYKCTTCKKYFKSERGLNEHMSLHTGGSLYKCPYCPKTFNVSANMHRHRKIVHPKEWSTHRIQRTSFVNLDRSNVSNAVII